MDYVKHFRSGVAFQAKSIAHVPCSYFADIYRKNQHTWGTNFVPPESSALDFYLGNHLSSAIAAEYGDYKPLCQPLIETFENYRDTTNMLGVKMFYYLLLICTRESRHAKITASLSASLAKKNGAACRDFTRDIQGMDGSETYTAFRDSPPEASLGAYTKHLMELFERAGWAGGYGGSAWYEVANCLNNFVWGDTSLEMMLDTAWALAHNNGPIFNKGIIFNSHDTWSLQLVLDTQRAGMLPGLVTRWDDYSKYYSHIGHYISDEAKEMVVNTSKGLSIDTTLCWFSLEELGAEGTYTELKDEQVSLFGHPKAEEMEKIKAVAEEKAAAKAKAEAEEAAKYYVVSDTQKVPKITREIIYGQAA